MWELMTGLLPDHDPEGHILINTGLAESASMIRSHVEALGFRFTDIKILLATHAHYDHVGEWRH